MVERSSSDWLLDYRSGRLQWLDIGQLSQCDLNILIQYQLPCLGRFLLSLCVMELDDPLGFVYNWTSEHNGFHIGNTANTAALDYEFSRRSRQFYFSFHFEDIMVHSSERQVILNSENECLISITNHLWTYLISRLVIHIHLLQCLQIGTIIISEFSERAWGNRHSRSSVSLQFVIITCSIDGLIRKRSMEIGNCDCD